MDLLYRNVRNERNSIYKYFYTFALLVNEAHTYFKVHKKQSLYNLFVVRCVQKEVMYMIEIFVPALLIAYLEAFRVAFNKSGYTYFMALSGRLC